MDMEIKGNYAASSFFIRQGIEIDLAKNCFRRVSKLFFLLKLKDAFKPLPKIDYILLFKTAYAKCEPRTIKDFENSSTIQLSFVHGTNRKLIVHESNNIEEVKQLARQLSRELNLKVKDSATDRRSPQWLC